MFNRPKAFKLYMKELESVNKAAEVRKAKRRSDSMVAMGAPRRKRAPRRYSKTSSYSTPRRSRFSASYARNRRFGKIQYGACARQTTQQRTTPHSIQSLLHAQSRHRPLNDPALPAAAEVALLADLIERAGATIAVQPSKCCDNVLRCSYPAHVPTPFASRSQETLLTHGFARTPGRAVQVTWTTQVYNITFGAMNTIW